MNGLPPLVVSFSFVTTELIRFIRRIPFLVFSGILIGYIILLPPEIVFL